MSATHYDPVEKIWSGPSKKDLYPPESNLSIEIVKTLKTNPDKVVQVVDPEGTETTAAKLLRNGELIAKEFLKLGIKSDDVVGIYASNTNNLAAVVLGCLLCGTPFNPIYAGFDKGEIKEIFEQTTPKVVCCDVENYEILKEALIEMKSQAIVYTVNGKISNVASIEDILSDSNDNFEETSFPGLHTDADEPMAIMCSSGTTGRPKGVLVSHRSSLNVKAYRDLNSDSVSFCYSPLYWLTGVWHLLKALLSGAKYLITNSPSTPENLLSLIEKYGITHLKASTKLITQVVQEVKTVEEPRLRSVHYLSFGGTHVPEHVGERIYELCGSPKTKPGPLIGYGMTEAAALTETDTDVLKRRYDNAGKIRPNNAIRIAADETASEFLGPNQSGFIFVWQPYKWAGYYRNPEATRKVYQNGWLNTGDVGYVDDEGHLFICARESEIFKTSNFQVNPNRLEELIMEMPGVAEVCIFGLPDLVATNLIACAVVRSKDPKGLPLTAAQVEKYVMENVAPTYHIKGGVYFLESLPRNVNGKLLRRKVLDLIKNKINK